MYSARAILAGIDSIDYINECEIAGLGLLPGASARIAQSINEDVASPKAVLSIFPNPASNEVNLVFGVDLEQIQIDIVNILGEKQEIKATITEQGVISLDVSVLKSGTYVCKIYQSGNLIQNEKIVIIK